MRGTGDGLTPKKRSKQRLAIMAAQGYEKRPPQCISCTHYQPARHGVPGQTPYLDPHCRLGHFAVQPHAICDKWQGKDGSTIA
jgi:hypothetical protein